MKALNLICIVSLLTGCAGMNTEFEHSKPAKDSGYWLQQADEMTDVSSNPNNMFGFTAGRVDIKQYQLLNTSLKLPVKFVGVPVSDTNNDNVKDVFEPKHITFSPTPPISAMECNMSHCYPEPGQPFRQNDRISRVWITPYISPDDNVHLGEIVYFVTKKSQWAGIQQGGK